MTPKDSNCIPPRKRITTIRVGKPCTTSPHINVLNMMKHMYMKATRETIIPAKVEMRKGATVKEVTPSTAKLRRLKKLNEDVPATRSSCSNLISFLRNPIQQYIPLVYLWLSRSCFKAFIQQRSNSLKSPTFGRISTRVVFCNNL